MKRTIRIGTRESELALWQAKTVQSQLEAQGYSTELVPIKSEGDIILNQPLYEIGITGLFTRTLDIALIEKRIDIAVHSMKDVPTLLPKGTMQAAVLKRKNSSDLLIHKGATDFEKDCIIATGSLRRQAQWLNRFPHHTVVDLRGNVNTRLKKVEDNNWTGAIFAAAGLERLGLKPENHLVLDWMTPAPAQGIIMVACMKDDEFTVNACALINDRDAELCALAERTFLRVLEGGCTAPIGGLATINGSEIVLKGVLLSLDGKEKLEINKSAPLEKAEWLGEQCALEILAQGGVEMMEEIKSSQK